MKKVLIIFQRAIDLLLIFFSVLFLIAGTYQTVDGCLVYIHAESTSVMKKNGQIEAEPIRNVPGMTAWLTIDDTSIDEPVMQGADNTEYLKKDCYGKYSVSGSLFLDSRNSADYTDSYSIIYGHHMRGGAMFGELSKFLAQEYLKTHTSGTLTVGENVYTLRIFATLDTDAQAMEVYAPQETDPEETWEYVKSNAVCWNDAVIDKTAAMPSRMIAFSTCGKEEQERTVVFGFLENVPESGTE